MHKKLISKLIKAQAKQNNFNLISSIQQGYHQIPSSSLYDDLKELVVHEIQMTDLAGIGFSTWLLYSSRRPHARPHFSVVQFYRQSSSTDR